MTDHAGCGNMMTPQEIRAAAVQAASRVFAAGCLPSAVGLVDYAEHIVEFITGAETSEPDSGAPSQPNTTGVDGREHGGMAVTMTWNSDEVCEIAVNGEDVIAMNHDRHGWDGMEAIRSTVAKIADIMGGQVVIVGEEGI